MENVHVMSTVNHQVIDNLANCVEQSADQYLKILDNPEVANLYDLVLEQVEEPLLKRVLKFVRNNQVRAAKLLGISRGTLRKKMKKYGLL
jgi:Fis family transcriptional regulator